MSNANFPEFTITHSDFLFQPLPDRADDSGMDWAEPDGNKLAAETMCDMLEWLRERDAIIGLSSSINGFSKIPIPGDNIVRNNFPSVYGARVFNIYDYGVHGKRLAGVYYIKEEDFKYTASGPEDYHDAINGIKSFLASYEIQEEDGHYVVLSESLKRSDVTTIVNGTCGGNVNQGDQNGSILVIRSNTWKSPPLVELKNLRATVCTGGARKSYKQTIECHPKGGGDSTTNEYTQYAGCDCSDDPTYVDSYSFDYLMSYYRLESKWSKEASQEHFEYEDDGVTYECDETTEGYSDAECITLGEDTTTYDETIYAYFDCTTIPCIKIEGDRKRGTIADYPNLIKDFIKNTSVLVLATGIDENETEKVTSGIYDPVEGSAFVKVQAKSVEIVEEGDSSSDSELSSSGGRSESSSGSDVSCEAARFLFKVGFSPDEVITELNKVNGLSSEFDYEVEWTGSGGEKYTDHIFHKRVRMIAEYFCYFYEPRQKLIESNE